MQGLNPPIAALLTPALSGRAGVRILDVASGAGEPAATLAAALPEAHVISTDVSARWAEAGKDKAAKLGLSNLTFETADGADLHAYGDASFDAVTCSLGLMYMSSHEKALAEFVRVLKPGGLLAVTAWQKREQFPFLDTTLQLALQYDPSASLEDALSATRFGDPAQLLADMSAAGLSGVACSVLQLEASIPAAVWWNAIVDMPLPVKAALAKAQEARPGDDVSGEAKQRLQQTLSEHRWLTEDGSLHIPNNGCWLISATKA